MILVINPHIRVGPPLSLNGGEARCYVDGADCGQLLVVAPELGLLLKKMTLDPGTPIDESAFARFTGDVDASAQTLELLEHGILRTVSDETRPPVLFTRRSGRVHLFDPAALMPFCGGLSGVLVLIAGIPAHAALAVAAVATYRQLPKVVEELKGSPTSVLGVVAILALAIVFHELSHAAVLCAVGGRVRSIGLTLRPWPGMYTDVRSVYLLKGRWERVAVFVAGPLATAFISDILTVFALGVGGALTVVGSVLLAAAWVNAALGLINLIPFRGTDGFNAIRHVLSEASSVSLPPSSEENSEAVL